MSSVCSIDPLRIDVNWFSQICRNIQDEGGVAIDQSERRLTIDFALISLVTSLAYE